MLTKFVDKIMRCIEALLIILLSTAVLIIFMQIIWRYALRTPLGWTEQIARAEFIWMVMLGIPVMFNRGITMSFDIFLQKITGRPHRIVTDHRPCFLCVLFFCIFPALYYHRQPGSLRHKDALQRAVRGPAGLCTAAVYCIFKTTE